MIRLIRILGYLCAGAGGLLLLAYLVPPLRHLWPLLRSLAWPIQLGLGLGALGFLVVLGSLIWERMEDWERERRIDDDL